MSSCLAVGRVHDRVSCVEGVYMWSVEARVDSVEHEPPCGTQDSCVFADQAAEVVDVRGRPGAHDQIEGFGVEGEVLGVGLVHPGGIADAPGEAGPQRCRRRLRSSRVLR